MNRRIASAAAAAALALSGLAISQATSGALAGDHPVALAPATPALGAGFSASGADCFQSGSPGTMNVTAQQLLSGNNTNGFETTNPDGTWLSSWTNTWGDGPGWYQVLGNCAGTSGLGFWTSEIFFVNDGTPVLAATFRPGQDPGEDPAFWYLAGSGCPSGRTLSFAGYDASNAEISSLSGAGQTAGGAFSLLYGPAQPPSGLTWIGACDLSGTEVALYDATVAGSTTTTTTTQPASASTTTTTAPAGNVSAAQDRPAATPVIAPAPYAG